MSAPALHRAVAAHGLPSSVPVAVHELNVDGWRALSLAAHDHRLMGLVSGAVADGVLPVPDSSREALEDLDEQWQSDALHLERLLLAIVAAFEAAGIEVRLFKGAALAHWVYDDPAHRLFGDIDLLVRGADLARARALLVAEFGGDDPVPEVRPGFDAEFAKDVLIRIDTTEVDLHRTLASGPFGVQIPAAELFENPAWVEIGGRRIATLGPTATFVQVCYNAALGNVPPRLMSLRDVAQVNRALQPAVDDVVALADRWGATAVVAHAVCTAWGELGLEACDMSRWAAAYRASRRDQRYLAASLSEDRSYTRQLAALAAIDGVGAKARYLRAIVSPSDEYLAARGWTRTSHLRRAARRLLPR